MYQTNFKTNIVIREKGHCIMLRGSIQEDNITTVNIYALNI